MRHVAYAIFFLLLFTIPWENVVLLPGIGTAARFVGLLALPVCLVYMVMARRLRFHWLLFWFAAFTAWSGITLLWVHSPDAYIRVQTFAQLLIMVGLIIQMLPERRDVERAFLAVVLGCYVTSISAIQTYLSNPAAAYQRFAASGFDPNDMAMTLNIGIALAWWLVVGSTGGIRRLVGLVFLPLGYAAVLLSASRSGFLAAGAASLYPVLLLGHRPAFRKALVSLALITVAAGFLAVYLVPDTIWARLSTIGREVHSGTLNYRSMIWASGLALFDRAPLFGVGAGNFNESLERLFGWGLAPHNVFLAIAVEYGLLGFFIFLGILYAAFARVPRMPIPERRLWYVLGLVLFLAFMSLNWEWRKQTWLVLGLAAAHGAALVEPRKAQTRQLVLTENT